MAEGEQSSDDRTEAATARHLDQAREAGRVPVSREAAMLASLALAVIAVWLRAPAIASDMAAETALALSDPHGASLARLEHVGRFVFAAVWPVVLAAAAGGAAAVLLQTNFLLHFGALSPQTGRVSPAAGLKGTATRRRRSAAG
jgi:flagellar biosynthetic protein FlhB